MKSQGSSTPRGSFVGLTTVDIIFGFDRYPVEDTKNTARQYTAAAGGPASNAAVVFSYLGGEAQLLSRLGKSAIADIARSDLAHYGVRHVDLANLPDDQPALSAIAISASNGSRTIFTSPAIDAELSKPFHDGHAVAFGTAVDIILLDGHQPMLAAYIAQRARENGIIVVLDGDLYGPHTEDLLPLVNIVIFGKSFVIPGTRSIREALDYFESFGIKHVIATNGSKQIDFVSEGILGSMEVEKVPVVDTLAAGDFFHGAFCYSYCRGHNIRQALKFAARVASRSVTTFGTRTWMDSYEPSAFE